MKSIKLLLLVLLMFTSIAVADIQTGEYVGSCELLEFVMGRTHLENITFRVFQYDNGDYGVSVQGLDSTPAGVYPIRLSESRGYLLVAEEETYSPTHRYIGVRLEFHSDNTITGGIQVLFADNDGRMRNESTLSSIQAELI